jgi:hypothetical protein
MKNTSIKLAIFLVVILVLAPMLSLAKNNANISRDVDGTLLPLHIKYKAFVHYPHPAKVGKRASLPPSCTVTQDDQIPDYKAAGWYFDTRPRVYHLNEATVPGSVGVQNIYSAVSNAWLAWRMADLEIVVSQGEGTYATKPKYDGINLLAWGSVPSGAIAVTYTWYNVVTGQQLESDTIFNSKLKWSHTPYSTDCGGVAGTYDVENIATHEFGHWIGLDDLYNSVDKDLTMYGYGFTAELKKDTLGWGDMEGANEVTPQPPG